MKFRKRPPLSQRDILILSLIGLLTVIVLSVLIGADIGLSRSVHGGGEFYTSWEGAQEFLFAHASPYSGAAINLGQELTYGRTAPAGENPYILTVPFFLMPLFFPFAMISDPNAARGLWMFVSELALVATALLSLRLIGWEPRRFFLVPYSLLAIVGFYSAISIIEGTPVVLLSLVYPAILITYSIEQDELAGLFLVFSLVYWEVGSLFLVLVFWKIFYEKRWRILAGFGMTLLVLLILSFLIYPGWILPFLTATLAAIRTPFGITAATIFARLAPTYNPRLSQVITLALAVALVYEWAATRKSDARRFVWTACLTLAVTPLIGFRTEMSNLVVLFPSLALIFAAATNRWRSGYWLTGLLLVLMFVLPWGLFVHWYLFQDQRSYDYLFLFYPLITIAGLYWTRWWFVRPPRTWFDHVRTELK